MKFKEAIEEIRTRADIVEIVGAHLTLKRAGRNLKGLCPFHAEKTPSFQVSPDRQLFHCFGCGEGGSVFDFIMKTRNYAFNEAVEYLAGRVGVIIDPPETGDQAQQQATQRLHNDYFHIHELAQAYFSQMLQQSALGEQAQHYLASRGVDASWQQKLKLGLAPDSWESLALHLATKGVNLKQASELGLVAPREKHPDQRGDYYDRFRSRIMFPIFDQKQRIIGFGGRHILAAGKVADGKEGGKYINSPQSPLFDKSRTFYLIDQAEAEMRAKRHAYIVEGYLDAIALHRAGIVNAVATLGTALTSQHGKVLSRYVDQVTLVFDGDAAGVKASQRGFDPLMQAGLDAHIVTLPAEHDPDSYLQAHGAIALREELGHAQPLLQFICHNILQAATPSREKALNLEEIAKSLRRIPNRVQQELLLQQFSRFTGVTLDTLRQLRQRGEGVSTQNNGNHLQSGQIFATATPHDKQPISAHGLEEMLVCLAFENENVYEMLRSYEGPALITQGLLRDILLEQFARGRKSAGDVMQVLQSIQQPEVRQQLQGKLFELADLSEVEQLKAARDCMQKILQRNYAARLRDLSEKIKLAEANKSAELTTLLQEKNDLLKQTASKRINP